MASKSRIDERNSLRMYVFKDRNVTTGNYHGRPMTVSEREKLMGYPTGYVEEPVQSLFETLYKDGLAHNWTIFSPWKEALDPKYHHFAGNYHCLPAAHSYGFKIRESEVELTMAPPSTGQPSFFDAKEYAKHLIGLAYSVPVVEELLSPLRDIFCQRVYTGYQYDYAWQQAKDHDI